MPSDNRLRLDENQCLSPPGSEPPQYDPEKPVGDGKTRMERSPFQDSKLLPESQILQEEIAARRKESDHRNKQQASPGAACEKLYTERAQIGYWS